MKKLLMLLAVLAPAFIMSCSKDTTPTTPPVVTVGVNLMPLAAGNYWIQTANTLDTLGTITETHIDTLTSSATMTYKAKNAAMIVNTNAGNKDTSYCASEGTKVYIGATTYEKVLNGFASAFGLKVKLSSDWVKVADYDMAAWTEPETQLKDLPVTYSGISGLMSGLVTINGSKGTNAQVTLNNKTYTANGYNISISFDGTVAAIGISDAAKVKINVNQKYWFIDGVGLYKSSTANTSLIIDINPLLQQANINQKFGGREATTTSFKLN